MLMCELRLTHSTAMRSTKQAITFSSCFHRLVVVERPCLVLLCILEQDKRVAILHQNFLMQLAAR